MFLRSCLDSFKANNGQLAFTVTDPLRNPRFRLAQNLDRTRTQMALVESIEKQMDDMMKVIEKY